MLSSVKVSSADASIKPSTYRNIVRQEANTKWFNLVKAPLGIYCLSSADSTRAPRFNALLRRVGEAPVIYDSTLTDYSIRALEGAMRNHGFLHARAEAHTTRNRHKTAIDYRLHPGEGYFIDSLAFEFDHPGIKRAVMADSALIPLRPGRSLNLDQLNETRNGIVKRLREKGYSRIHKEFITFAVDTLPEDRGAAVTLRFAAPTSVDTARAYSPQHFGRITVNEYPHGTATPTDTAFVRDVEFRYHGKLNLWRTTYLNHISIIPNSLYSDVAIQNTYASLNALPAVSYTSIKLNDTPSGKTDCDITVHLNKPHTIGAELEGTNTAGDLGMALALTYSNRNLFRDAEMLTFKLRGAYEAISGLEGYNGKNYMEWSGELGLNFPTLLLPGVSRAAKRRLKASSVASFVYNSQDRPEFHRRVLTASWVYKWQPINRPRLNHRFDLFSLNYVYMPWISETFRNDYLEGDDPHYSVLRYSYTNLFIMRSAYNFTYNTLRTADSPTGLYQTNGFQVRAGVEIAGNLLYALSKLSKAERKSDGYHHFLGIAYSQYARFDLDLTKSFVINDRNSCALHFAFGIAQPYGNSTILPYEKRYFAGGANSVRGWSVRELGPGTFRGKDGKIDFINQTGNLRLEANVEYRTRLFGKLHGAAFVDAGNVWNTRDYPDQPGGLFRFNSFYKQIAVSYGLGIRLNLDYFVLRLDGGMKAVNPAYANRRDHLPLIHPDFSRDFTFHFAVGLPF